MSGMDQDDYLDRIVAARRSSRTKFHVLLLSHCRNCLAILYSQISPLLFSRMAEIVGLIASGISIVEVAAKIGGHVLAIKKLWDEIKDVPHTLQSLTDEVGLLSSVLHDLEADSDTAHSVAQSPSDNARGQTIKYCRIALDDLEGVAAELITQINSSKRFKRSTAKVKVVLRRGVWEKLEQRLQKITRILALAQQCYLL